MLRILQVPEAEKWKESRRIRASRTERREGSLVLHEKRQQARQEPSPGGNIAACYLQVVCPCYTSALVGGQQTTARGKEASVPEYFGGTWQGKDPAYPHLSKLVPNARVLCACCDRQMNNSIESGSSEHLGSLGDKQKLFNMGLLKPSTEGVCY